MSLNVIPRAFGTCLVDISNACSDFFAKKLIVSQVAEKAQKKYPE
jgi:hypothetical protein